MSNKAVGRGGFRYGSKGQSGKNRKVSRVKHSLYTNRPIRHTDNKAFGIDYGALLEHA